MNIYIPSLDNKELLDKYLKYNTTRECEFNVANPILWSRHYNTGFVIVDDTLVFCTLNDGKPVSFTFPVGMGDVKVAFDSLVEYCDKQGIDFNMYLVSPEQYSVINEWYPDEYSITYDRDSADYLYESESLASLSGKKLHGKRNHINRFLEQYPDYVYESIDDSNYMECIKLADDWSKNNEDTDNEAIYDDMSYEHCALKFALEHREELCMKGALIRVEGKVVAFTLGGRITDDTFDVNFEKAYADVQGAYAMINREFVRRELIADYKYINREEDMGLPGLRHAKTSYQPVCLIEKGRVYKKSMPE